MGISDSLISALRDKHRQPGRIPFTAAFAGVVTELGVREGAYVNQGTSILELAATDPVWITIDVPQSRTAAVAIGSNVSIHVDAYPDRDLHGRVDYLYSAVDPDTRTLRGRVVASNPQGLLRANMYVTVDLTRSDAQPVVSVPREAVIHGGQSDRVIVALGSGRFASRTVRVGPESDDRIVIRDGLVGDEQVVAAGTFLIDSETELRSGLDRISVAP
jgi:Cu(I)/Ag(I) efflux system membrane fusion protein